MTAKAVARRCYEKYAAIEQLPEEMREDIDALAGYFWANGTFKGYFVDTLVPWDDLAGEPNSGHAAIGDFLLTTAAYAALSANFDTLIEQWCKQHKVAFRGALNSVQANAYAMKARPLLKFHGCMDIDPANTVWTKAQLTAEPTQERITSCRGWMIDHLPQKDLFIVGFWTDWAYLNEVLEGLLNGQNPGSVTVIDPLPTAELIEKAPNLWDIVSGLPNFAHIQMSSDEALTELRTEFSKVWVRRLLGKGGPLYEIDGGACPAGHLECPNLNADELYDLRRDAEGLSYMRAARTRTPSDDAGLVALARMLLMDAGAALDGAWFKLDDQTIRVVNGQNRSLRQMEDSYNEPSSTGVADMIVAAGAFDGVLPGNLVRSGGDKRITRQSRGGGSRWVTLDQAQEDLGL
jgi:hypothetical protein